MGKPEAESGAKSKERSPGRRRHGGGGSALGVCWWLLFWRRCCVSFGVAVCCLLVVGRWLLSVVCYLPVLVAVVW